MARYVVTGGAGFIGSNLVSYLVNNGHDVIVVDSLHTGSYDLIKDLNVKFFKETVDEFYRKENWKNIDGIFHLGKPSSSPMYRENRWKFVESVNGTIAVLEMAKELGVKVVTASSSSLYNGLEPPHREDMIIKPTDFYTEGRLIEERLAKVYNDLYGVKYAAMRFFSVYGPNEQYKKGFANLISQFIWMFMKNKSPVIYGDGEQRRDFIFVTDVVNALVLAMEKDAVGIFNVGTGKSYSLNQAGAIIKKKMKVNIDPVYVENKIKNYVQVTQASTEKAERELGFRAKTDIENGIEKTISYYSKIGTIPDL